MSDAPEVLFVFFEKDDFGEDEKISGFKTPLPGGKIYYSGDGDFVSNLKNKNKNLEARLSSLYEKCLALATEIEDLADEY